MLYRFQIAGPNSTINLGSFVIVIERQIDYVLSCIRKIQRQRINSMSVKKQAVQDFQNYCDAYFPRTVFARKVRRAFHASLNGATHARTSAAIGTRKGRPMLE